MIVMTDFARRSDAHMQVGYLMECSVLLGWQRWNDFYFVINENDFLEESFIEEDFYFVRNKNAFF